MAFCDETSLDQQYLTLLGRLAAGGPGGAGGFTLDMSGGEQRMLFRMEALPRNNSISMLPAMDRNF